MLEVRDLMRELNKVEQLALDKKDPKKQAQAKSTYQRLRSMVLADIAKTGDSRVRGLLKTLSDFAARKLV